MNEQKHTPGPWHLDASSDGSMAIMPEVGFSICSLGPRAGFKRDIPNFHLMAAAPELLDALTDLVGGCGKEGDLFSSEAMEKARAAIAKAEGG